jgi:hypothetical protein
MTNKLLAADLGYGFTKGQAVINGETRSTFSPSAVIVRPPVGFSIGQKHIGVEIDGVQYLVGSQVRKLVPTDRDHQLTSDWTKTDEWLALFITTASVLFPGGGQIAVCTGLPLGHYTEENKAFLQERIQAVTSITPLEGDPIAVDFTTVRVVPQPWGTFLSLAFDARGELTNDALLDRRVLVVDIGSRTTNLLVTIDLDTVDEESTTVLEGLWDCAARLKAWAEDEGQPITSAQALDSLKSGKYRWRGREYSCRDTADKILNDFAYRVQSAISARSGSGLGQIDKILVSGGGGAMLNGRLQRLIDHGDMTVVPDAFWANSTGYIRFLRFLQSRQ